MNLTCLHRKTVELPNKASWASPHVLLHLQELSDLLGVLTQSSFICDVRCFLVPTVVTTLVLIASLRRMWEPFMSCCHVNTAT